MTNIQYFSITISQTVMGHLNLMPCNHQNLLDSLSKQVLGHVFVACHALAIVVRLAVSVLQPAYLYVFVMCFGEDNSAISLDRRVG